MNTALGVVKDERTKRLRAVYQHPHAKAIINVLGAMPEGTKSVNITELEKRIPGLSRKEIVMAARKVTAGTMGSFKTGRKGYDSRIEHWVSVRRIYETATAKEEPPPPPPLPKFVSHTFHLRPHIDLKIDLPEDLTKEEAARIGALLMAIPF